MSCATAAAAALYLRSGPGPIAGPLRPSSCACDQSVIDGLLLDGPVEKFVMLQLASLSEHDCLWFP